MSEAKTWFVQIDDGTYTKGTPPNSIKVQVVNGKLETASFPSGIVSASISFHPCKQKSTSAGFKLKVSWKWNDHDAIVITIGIFLPKWGNETRFSIKTFDFENWNFEQPLRPPFDKN